MFQPLSSTFFAKQPQFKFKLRSVFIFIALAFVVWEINILGQIIFPSQKLIPYFARSVIMLATDLALIYISFRLLKQNNLPKEALGLSISNKTISDIFWGSLIGVLGVAIIAGLLFMYIPYHFIPGSIGASQFLKESVFYLLDNSLEELIFRGFLFIIFSQLAGWRVSSLILAFPFGLFHLQGIGLNMDGLKIFTTTACYSFVFSLSYVLFRSMWASISVHVMSNIFLHTVTGLDGANRALFKPDFEGSWPKGNNLSFSIVILSAIIISGSLLLFIALFDKKHGSIRNWSHKEAR